MSLSQFSTNLPAKEQRGFLVFSHGKRKFKILFLQIKMRSESHLHKDFIFCVRVPGCPVLWTHSLAITSLLRSTMSLSTLLSPCVGQSSSFYVEQLSNDSLACHENQVENPFCLFLFKTACPASAKCSLLSLDYAPPLLEARVDLMFLLLVGHV